ncbi:MAG: restriction endonuclease [Planctomycetes bacterium]|nr:restriction endonuclease [Planctomycetota bacterium]
MIASSPSITLSEWQTLGPENCNELRGRFLDQSDAVTSVASSLKDSRLLDLTELRSGLEIRAFSHVGRIRIGDLNITVLPKLRGSSLLKLLRYAYGFRRLNLISDTSHLIEPCGFEDLLVAQLNAEAQELLSRGLQRSYVARNEMLASPRGRIDIQELALNGGKITAALPCRHYPRIEDTMLNQALVAGLKLAGSLASSVALRREARRLAAQVEEQVSPINLNSAVMNQVARQVNRLTKSYRPAMSIIRLLVESQGVTLEGEALTSRLPGFMFDMNAFFQALLSQFLRDNLPGYSVIDEHSLKGMMRYNPNFSPPRRSPTPRPDYVVQRGNKSCSILDAKYRDIWEKDLPRHMLYQLVVYAVSHRDNPRSTILYPTFNPAARETRIDVTDPVHGRMLGQVCLRPVNLEHLEALVTNLTANGRRMREQYAASLALDAQDAM